MFRNATKLFATIVAIALLGLTATACGNSSSDDEAIQQLQAEANNAMMRAIGEPATPAQIAELDALANSMGVRKSLIIEPHHGLKPKYYIDLTVFTNHQPCVPVTVSNPDIVVVSNPDDLAKVKPAWQPAVRNIRANPEISEMRLTDTVYITMVGYFSQKLQYEIAATALKTIRDTRACGLGPAI